jgi:DNA polymerase-1
LDLSQAEEFVREYQRVMGTLTQWMNGQLGRMREQGYVESVTGRRRRFPLITHTNLDDARKSAVHAPIAGAASDINSMAMIRVREANIPGVRLLATVHDEIDFEVPKDMVNEAIPAVLDIMVDAAHEVVPNIPWTIDAEIGPSWGSIEKSGFVAKTK